MEILNWNGLTIYNLILYLYEARAETNASNFDHCLQAVYRLEKTLIGTSKETIEVTHIFKRYTSTIAFPFHIPEGIVTHRICLGATRE